MNEDGGKSSEHDAVRDQNENDDADSSKVLTSSIKFFTQKEFRKYITTPDEEISRSQVTQGSKRFSGFSEDSLFLMSPASTPPLRRNASEFALPLIYTVGTVKKKKMCDETLEDRDKTPVQYVKAQSNVFDALGMTDKDISWSSDMETPAPQRLTLSEYNTIERATFLPETNLKDCTNMQPRALFSPYLGDDLDCQPLNYSSGSDDDLPIVKPRNEHIKTSKHVPTSTPLEMSQSDGVAAKIIGDNCQSQERDASRDVTPPPQSPIIKIKQTKRVAKQKSQPVLAKSLAAIADENKPEDDINRCNDIEKGSDGNVKEKTVIQVEAKRGCLDERLCSIEDDYFKNVSFSYIDKLCDNLPGDREDEPCSNGSNKLFSVVSKSVGDNTLSNLIGHSMKDNVKNSQVLLMTKENIALKYYYNTNGQNDKLHPISSLHDFLLSTKRLEEGGWLCTKKYMKAVANDNFTIFSEIASVLPKIESSLSERKTEESPVGESNSNQNKENENVELKESNTLGNVKKKKMCHKGEEAVEDMSSYFDGNDSQMCVTADYVESLMNSMKSENNSSINLIGGNTSGQCSLNLETDNNVSNTGLNRNASESVSSVHHYNVEQDVGDKGKGDGRDFISCGFKTACGAPVRVLEKSMNKVKHMFKELEDEASDLVHQEKRTSEPERVGFKTASGSAIRISEKSLNKVKEIFGEFEELQSNCDTNVPDCVGFKTASGTAISVSDDSLNKVKKMFREFEEVRSTSDASAPECVGFKTASGSAVSVSKKSLNKVKEMFGEFEELQSTCDTNVPDYVGFKTASGAKVSVSDKSLNKVKKMFREIEDNQSSNDTSVTESVGFKTASGSEGRVSEKSLNKVKFKEMDVKSSEQLSKASSPECAKSVFNRQMSVKQRINSGAGEEGRAFKSVPKMFGFNTASGKNIVVSEKAVEEAKKFLGDGTGMEVDNVDMVNAGPPLPQETLNSLETDLAVAGDMTSQWSESSDAIPPWLHAYATSPTLTEDRMGLAPTVSGEDGSGKPCLPKEEFVITSPILRSTDRFYNARRRRNQGRRLNFEVEEPSRKRDRSQVDADCGGPFKRQKLSEEVREVAVELTADVLAERRKARLEQVQVGKRRGAKPRMGSHLAKKQEPQTRLRDAVDGAYPEVYADYDLRRHGLREDLLSITAFNASEYKFSSLDFHTSEACRTNVNGFLVGDGCRLIYDEDNTAGADAFARAFFACPDVDRGLVSEDWVRNHYKWIVWKLSHYERSFPRVFGGKCLTPNVVMLQLKYRYDREVDRSQRPVLKKVLERDESPANRMVLCVSDIKKQTISESVQGDLGNVKSAYKLGLTDGWYCCYAEIDPAMTPLVEEGKVVVGTKLMIHGAELLNCDNGITPLEAGENVHLKIHTNSTRRTKWDVKMGLQRNRGPLLVSLKSILPNGGPVGRVDVIVVRVYPVLYMEKMPDGTNVTRNSRAEDKAAAVFQQRRETQVEKMYEEAREEMRRRGKDKERSGAKLSKSTVSGVVDPEELYRLCQSCADPSALQELLTPQQRDVLMNYQMQRNEMKNKELMDIVREKMSSGMTARKVTRLMRVKIVDVRSPDYGNPTVFTLWNVTDDMTQCLSEGKAYTIYNTAPSNSRFSRPVQLNSTRQTQYKELTPSSDYPARRLTRLSDFTPDFHPPFNEVDFVGVVVVSDKTRVGSRVSETIFVSDLELNVVGIVLWGSSKDWGWENVLAARTVVACSNLQWHSRRNARGVPSVYATDSSLFTVNPKQTYLKEEVSRVKASLPQDLSSFIVKCEEEIRRKMEEPKQPAKDAAPWLTGDAAAKFQAKPMASSTPLKGIGAFALDTSGAEPSPIQKRIDRLSAYGEPPPLSPLLPLDNLDKFRTKFRVPFKNPGAGVNKST